MQPRPTRTRTDSTEDSESSSSSPNNGTSAAQASAGAADGWSTAAAVVSIIAVTESVTATATAHPAASSKSGTVWRATQQRLTLPARLHQRQQQRRLRRSIRQAAVAARRRQLPTSSSLLQRDLAPSDEAAHDADDEASASAASASSEEETGLAVHEFNDFDEGEDGDAEADFEEVVGAVEDVEADEALVVEEAQSSDEFATAGAMPPWQATNDDFVEFVVDDNVPAAAGTAAAPGSWVGERMHRDTWRLFRRRRAVALAVAASSNFLPPASRRDGSANRRRSLPVRPAPSGQASSSADASTPTLLTARLRFSDGGGGAQPEATKSVAMEEVSIAPDLMQRFSREVLCGCDSDF